jgi:hypothetical protein
MLQQFHSGNNLRLQNFAFLRSIFKPFLLSEIDSNFQENAMLTTKEKKRREDEKLF